MVFQRGKNVACFINFISVRIVQTISTLFITSPELTLTLVKNRPGFNLSWGLSNIGDWNCWYWLIHPI